jgi:BirA family biotin operon repressor/biotin-[acetyl-CoA-carboxylase] ligase
MTLVNPFDLPHWQLASVDSTNNFAKRLMVARTVKSPIFWVTAQTQTQGRGTQGRPWVSPPGAGLYLTVGFQRGQQLLCYDPELPMKAAHACIAAIHQVLGVTIDLKPVNDLVWHGGKLGGLLTESSIASPVGYRWLIIGVGLNIQPIELPPGFVPSASGPPTSLQAVLGRSVSSEEVFALTHALVQGLIPVVLPV